MNKLTLAALALAVIGFATTTASADVTVGSEDLVLGFQIASGTGASTNLEVDLGNFSLFTDPLTLNQLKVADLTSTYGANWASTTLGTGVNWAVAGITPDVAGGSFYATSSTNIKTNSLGGLGTAYANISAFTSGLNGQTSTANSSSAANIGDSSNAASSIGNSYTSTEQGNGFTFVPNAETTGAGSLDLYSFTPQAQTGTGPNKKFPDAIKLGTFTLSDSGVLTYQTALAVPEPSAYALGACAVLLFIVLRRRHSVA